MTDDEAQALASELKAEAERLKAPLASATQEQIKWARFFTKCERDCASASAVGGASIALALLLQQTTLHAVSFDILTALASALLFGAAAFDLLCQRKLPSNQSGADTVAQVGSVIVAVTFQLTHAATASISTVGSRSWSIVLAASLVFATVGAVVRRLAETRLETLDLVKATS